jgi:hypothetical protein
MTDPDPKGPKTYGSGSTILVGSRSLPTRRLFLHVYSCAYFPVFQIWISTVSAQVLLDPDPVAMKFTKMEKISVMLLYLTSYR